MASKQLKTLGNVEINPVVDNPLPSPADEQYKKILINDNKTVKWDNDLPFGSGSTECGCTYITPKMLIKVPKDFSPDGNHGWASDSDLEWIDAVPPAPNPNFVQNTPVGTKKSYNLKATVQNINERFYNESEFNYGWEETQNIPDPNDANNPASQNDVLTFDGDDIVWAAPQGGGSDLPAYSQTEAGKVLTVNQAGDGLTWENAGGGGESIPSHTNSNVGQALGVIGLYEYAGYGTYNLTGNKIGWTETVPIISNYMHEVQLGSAGDWGFNKGIRVVIPTYDPSEESPESPKYEYGAFMNYDYGSTWPCNNNYQWWDNTNSTTIKSCKIKNHSYVHMASIDSPNTLTTVNITIIRKKFEPAHALIEFANELDTDLQLYIGQSNEWNGEEPDYQIVKPMVAAGASYTDAHKIPAKSFISVQVLGHGYFINHRPLTEQEIDNIVWLNEGDVALNSEDATNFY